MMSMEEAKAFFDDKEKSLVESVCELLRGHEHIILNHIADFVASICDVDKNLMLMDCDKAYIAQARWMYWYAVRYMTNDTYEKIAERTALQGHSFASSSIGLCINKMSQLIETSPIWAHRWATIKAIIKAWMNTSSNGQQKEVIRVTVHSPKDYDIKFDLKKE